MKNILISLMTAFALAMPALAAELTATKAPPPAPPPSPWDVAFGGALTSDYIYRGITQSNHKPSVSAYFEPRYNVIKDVQLYAGISGSSISFPNRAALEVDLYGGVRPTFGKLALDFGFIYYWYPGGDCFNGSLAPVFGADCLANGYLPVNGNVIKADLSFLEFYAKAVYAVNDQVSFGAAVYYSENVLNSGADGTYLVATAKFTAPSSLLPTGYGLYVSGEVGYWSLGTSDQFYCTQVGAAACTPPFPNGIPYADYTTWNVGLGITKGVFTLDMRYYDTDLNRGDCNAFTSDHTATFTGDFTAINPGGFGSKWCDRRFVVKGSFDLTAATNLK